MKPALLTPAALPLQLRRHIQETDGHWLWTGSYTVSNARPKTGLHINGAWVTLAARACLLLLIGPSLFPDEAYALHKCGDKRCVRPSLRTDKILHVVWGTDAENRADRIVFGENATGERHPAHKLTVADVQAIRQSTAPTRTLARQYAVAPPTVRAARLGLTWQGVA